MKQSHERCLKCLTAIYEDCEKKGIICNMKFYAETYGTNPSIGAALQRLGYIEKIEDGKNASYKRRVSMRIPDERMVLEVMDELKPKSTSAPTPIIASNLVPASEYKNKVKAEIEAEIKSNTIEDFMKAAALTQIIGINLLSLKKEEIVSFIERMKK